MELPEELTELIWDEVRRRIRPGLKRRLWERLHMELRRAWMCRVFFPMRDQLAPIIYQVYLENPPHNRIANRTASYFAYTILLDEWGLNGSRAHFSYHKVYYSIPFDWKRVLDRRALNNCFSRVASHYTVYLNDLGARS